LKKEKHYFAHESDRGGLLPLGFGISAAPGRLKSMLELQQYFEPYGIVRFSEGGGGADIGPLGKFGTPTASIVPDANRYFDYHHSANDTFDKVNIRELQLGSAAIASLIYLIDKFDL
jgi:carboxypeptidase Q